MHRSEIYVFLDFDGVTHPLREVEDFRCLPRIEAVLREFDECRVVITSDWRTLFSLRRLQTHFSDDIRERVIGTTPLLLPTHGADFYGLREAEARQWLAQRQAADAPWLAIDDAPGNWPTRARLLLTDFKCGFMDDDAERMRTVLRALRAGTHHEADDPSPRLAWGRPELAPGT
ncbi:HAD domain-containing protein [Denitromonas iodatirespirans]|uniref:Uncharacterized protein n=1 Tax=Denitromonas iodatirespirans TaxID=2795389 RepID=A0A944H665_DENI1|nr:HAD domain-containing protein [Denitromonas iodatirespirans]MBT0959843.1 hypothetical protein [Denitromonas iodatirespirans]